MTTLRFIPNEEEANPRVVLVTETVPHKVILDRYEEWMTVCGSRTDTVSWHLVILDNFLKTWLPENGYVVLRVLPEG